MVFGVIANYPRANIGVSGKLQDVCKRRSSRGLCAERLGNAPDMMRRRELHELVNSCGRVPGACGDIETLLFL